MYAGRAVEMDALFKKWMAWYGKKYSPYKLYQERNFFWRQILRTYGTNEVSQSFIILSNYMNLHLDVKYDFERLLTL